MKSGHAEFTPLPGPETRIVPATFELPQCVDSNFQKSQSKNQKRPVTSERAGVFGRQRTFGEQGTYAESRAGCAPSLLPVAEVRGLHIGVVFRVVAGYTRGVAH